MARVPCTCSRERASPSLAEILLLEVDDGVAQLTERALRDVVAVDDWAEQRRRWLGLFAGATRG